MQTMKGLIERAKDSNAAYKAASPAEKRVMIARDVIAALDAQDLIARKGYYLHLPNESEDWRDSLRPQLRANAEGSFQSMIPALPPCNVCAKGALFVCAVARQNEVTNGAVVELGQSGFLGEAMSRAMGGIFDGGTLSIIEAEFEDEMFDDACSEYAPVMDLSDLKPEGRMRAIMQNIIDNGGEFKPTPVVP